MNRWLNCYGSRNLSPSWLIGSSLAAVAAMVVLRWAGAELPAMAMLCAAFPMSLLIADPRLRNRQPARLVVYMGLHYGFMLAVATLAEAL